MKIKRFAPRLERGGARNIDSFRRRRKDKKSNVNYLTDRGKTGAYVVGISSCRFCGVKWDGKGGAYFQGGLGQGGGATRLKKGKSDNCKHGKTLSLNA